MFLEVSTDRISGNNIVSGMEFSKNVILKKIFKDDYTNTFQIDALNIKDHEIGIRGKNLYILVEGETVYIKMITLPLVKKHLINDLIKNELRYYYKDIEHIAFTYKLIKKDKFSMEILVFCLKGNSLAILENCLDNNINLKKVNLIQFSIKNYYANKISEKNYILVFYYNHNLYILISQNDVIVANAITNVKDLLLFKFSYYFFFNLMFYFKL